MCGLAALVFKGAFVGGGPTNTTIAAANDNDNDMKHPYLAELPIRVFSSLASNIVLDSCFVVLIFHTCSF